MSFVSLYRPAFLWGLLFIAAPIIIHFFNRKRTTLLDFSTLRFFQSTALRASRVRRLKRILLLCARCLLIAVIVALFAKPYDKHDPFAALFDPNGTVFCWIDPTLSMDYKDNGVQLWQKSVRLLDSLDRRLPPSSSQYWFDDAKGDFIPRKAPAFVKANFPRNGPAHFEKMINAVAGRTANVSGLPVIIIVSDFQENCSRALDSFFLEHQMKIPIMGVSVAPHDAWNFGIQKTSVSREQPSTVMSTFYAQGRKCPLTGVSVMSGKMRLGHSAVDIGANEKVTRNMDIAKDGRFGGGFVRLDIEDPFSPDNVNYFAGEGNKCLRVLILGDSVKCFPIVAAFRSMGKDFWDPVIRRDPQVMTYNDIDSADCVVLNEVLFFPRAVQLLISTRSMDRKTVLFSPEVDSGSTFALTEVLKMLGKDQKPVSVGDGKPRFLVYSDTVSSLWRGFHGLKSIDVEIHRYFDPLPGQVLCRLDNQRPFATHIMDSLGNSWVLFATPIGITQSNNLCETGTYVPILDRVSRFALGSLHKSTEEWIAGRLQRNPFYGSRHPALVDNDRGIRVTQWDNQPWVVFDEPGLYRIQPFGLPSYQVAVNIDPEEALLQYRFPKAPSRWAGFVRLYEYQDFLHRLHDEKAGVFSYILWILLAAFLLAEIALWEKVDKKVETQKQLANQ